MIEITKLDDLAPRLCQWFIDINKKITSNGIK